MHELKITGDTPEALYVNVVKTLSMFLQGPTTTAVSETGASEAAVSRTSDVAPVEPEPAPPKPARGKGAKTKVEKMDNDDISDVGADKTIENEPKALTLEGDIIPRLQAIQAAAVKRGSSMPDCVKYIQKLYGPFGIANAKQLKPEQFEEFLEASEGYLSGEA